MIFKGNKIASSLPSSSSFLLPSETEQGELCFRGRHIMMGYLANPSFGKEHVEEIQKKTAEAIDAQGFMHSGDKGIGYVVKGDVQNGTPM